MRALYVELLAERVEPLLLLEQVLAGGTRRLLLQREVHALVLAVLFGVAGLDTLRTHSEAKPERGETTQAGHRLRRRERCPVVGADHLRNAVLRERLRECELDRI